MKTSSKVLLIFLMIPALSFSQGVPNLINYQAVLRDAGGVVLANNQTSLRLSILKAGPTGPVVYGEKHAVVTGGTGLFNIQIGGGFDQDSSLAEIDWADAAYFLKVEIDASGGVQYQEIGVSQLVAVPYAHHAKTAESLSSTDGFIGPTGPTGPEGPQGQVGSTGPQGEQGADGQDGVTGPTGPQGEQGQTGPAGAPGSDGEDGLPGATGPTGPAGEGIPQNITMSSDGDTLYLSDGGGFVLLVRGCPSGSVAVNREYCIEIDETGGDINWLQAAERCVDLGGHLCSTAEWKVACSKKDELGILNMDNNKWEWSDDATSNNNNNFVLLGQNSCTSITSNGQYEDSYRHRCCFDR